MHRCRDGLNMPSDEHWNVSTRVPIGPVGVITPWNTPFMLSTWKIAPALAAGCTVVHKPAEWSPVTADLLAKLAKQAGLPDGVLNTVHGMGEEAGKALTEHPLDPATEIGPLIHERHLAKVCSYFDVARKDGAIIAVGGKPHDGPGGGHYVQPTLVTGAHSRMRVAQEEVFGPFLTVISFRDEKEAVEIANGVQYGLTGYVWTGDMGRALRVADALEAGMIWLNSENVRHLPTPFGGMKSSGIGRDGGDYSFDFYMETKHVSLARGTHKIQKLGL